MDGSARILVASGNLYGFQSVYVPVLAQLQGLASIHCVVLDFPKGRDLTELRQTLAAMPHVEGLELVPNDVELWRHHRAVAGLCRRIRRGRPLDMLLIDGDVMPMARYLIGAARRRGAKVVVLQKEVPKRALVLYAAGAALAPTAGGGTWSPRLRRLVRGPDRSGLIRSGLRTVWQTVRRQARVACHFYILPWIWTARPFATSARELQGPGFVPRRADLVIVYTPRIRQMLRHFAPELPVVVAEYPLAGSCRCADAPPSAGLLVVLTGPWRNYVDRDNPPERMLARWASLIERAVEVGHFSRVDIRPHPREVQPYPQRLVERLTEAGVNAALADPGRSPLSRLVCDYQAVIGPPSGALAEAAASCRRVGVLCVEGMQGSRPDAPVEGFSEHLVRVAPDAPLEARHFLRPTCEAPAAATVRVIVERLLLGQPVEAAPPAGTDGSGAGIEAAGEPTMSVTSVG